MEVAAETGAETEVEAGLETGVETQIKGEAGFGEARLLYVAVEVNLVDMLIRHGGRTRKPGTDRTGSYGVYL